MKPTIFEFQDDELIWDYYIYHVNIEPVQYVMGREEHNKVKHDPNQDFIGFISQLVAIHMGLTE